MSKEDDDDDSSAIGVGRYPCMPSLVALQQMRNRLHLAYLGKKLMKWSALASGRELRRIALEINEIYDNFSEDMANAYLLLARCRYHNPGLNKIVLENVGEKAAVTLQTSVKMVSGVRIMEISIKETDTQPYKHLGISQGGQVIKETKLAWLELLRRMIKIVELRTSFQTVEYSHKSATKKFNVLAKIIIPKILSTIYYILMELEELAREELYRIKKVVQYKQKKKLAERKGKETPPTPPLDFSIFDEPPTHAPQYKASETIFHPLPPCAICDETCSKSKPRDPNITDGIEPELGPIKLNEVIKPPLPMSCLDAIRTKTPIPVDIKDERKESRELTKLQELYRYLDEAIRESQRTAAVDSCLEDFLERIKDVKRKLEEYFVPSKPTDETEPLKYLHSNIQSVIDINTRTIEENLALSGDDQFKEKCEELYSIIHTFLNQKSKEAEKSVVIITDTKSVNEEDEKDEDDDEEKDKQEYDYDITKLTNQIDDSMKFTQRAKEHGVLPSKVDKYIASPYEKIKSFLLDNLDQPTASTEEKDSKGSVSDLQTNLDELIKMINKLNNVEFRSNSVSYITGGKVKSESAYGTCLKSKTDAICIPHKPSTCGVCQRDAELENSILKYINAPKETDSKKSMHSSFRQSSSFLTLCDSCYFTPYPCQMCEDLSEDSANLETIYKSTSGTSNPSYSRYSRSKSNPSQLTSDRITPAPSCSFDCSHTSRRANRSTHSLSTCTKCSYASIDSSLGIFENRINKIVRIKRVRKSDGTVYEEKETVTIREDTHDPTKTSFDTITSDQEGNMSKPSDKKIGYCIVSDEMTFRNTQSEYLLREIPFQRFQIRSLSDTDNLLHNPEHQACPTASSWLSASNNVF